MMDKQQLICILMHLMKSPLWLAGFVSPVRPEIDTLLMLTHVEQFESKF